MALSKYKLKDLLELVDERNSNLEYTIDNVKGISIQKCFIETKADMEGVSLRPYILVKPDSFAYVPVTSRNGEKITIAHNTTDDTYIVSSSYIVFKVKQTDTLDSDYLFMYFNRPEFDRFSRFNSWGSARETFDWKTMCDIEIELPSIDIQRKYVAVYNAMVENQKAYEQGLEDLRLVYEGFFDEIKKNDDICISATEIIEKYEIKNSENKYSLESVRGISNQKKFITTKADVSNSDLSKFLLVKKEMFAYNSRTDGRDMLVLAYNRSDEEYLVTNNYNTFRVKPSLKAVVNAEYLYCYFCRAEFDRAVRFHSWGSSQELLTWNNFGEMVIPIPPIEIQNAIAEINLAYIERKEINEQLKAQIKDICPILIKGSLDEARV